VQVDSGATMTITAGGVLGDDLDIQGTLYWNNNSALTLDNGAWPGGSEVPSILTESTSHVYISPSQSANYARVVNKNANIHSHITNDGGIWDDSFFGKYYFGVAFWNKNGGTVKLEKKNAQGTGVLLGSMDGDTSTGGVSYYQDSTTGYTVLLDGSTLSGAAGLTFAAGTLNANSMVDSGALAATLFSSAGGVVFGKSDGTGSLQVSLGQSAGAVHNYCHLTVDAAFLTIHAGTQLNYFYDIGLTQNSEIFVTDDPNGVTIDAPVAGVSSVSSTVTTYDGSGSVLTMDVISSTGGQITDNSGGWAPAGYSSHLSGDGKTAYFTQP
jgi:hypothetical protein